MQIHKNISLINHNTFRVDNSAETLILIENDEDLGNLLKDENYSLKSKFFLGAGSNLLITRPIKGLTIKNIQTSIKIVEENSEFAIIEVDSGLEWHNFVSFCLDNCYYGLENLALIPGLIGAAPVQNIGAYGVEQQKYFDSLICIDLNTGQQKVMYGNDCNFDYRHSIFKQEEYKSCFITKVRYKLKKSFEPDISYKDLKIFFQDKTNIQAKDLFDAVVEIRNNKLPNHNETPNAGSFFKNPILDENQLKDLLTIEPNIVYYPIQNNMFKVSAANLIEKAGLKGYRKKNVGISIKHSLIIANFGNSSGEEIYDFAKFVISVLIDKYKIRLEPEVIII